MGVRQQLELVGCAAGIYGAYLTQGYVQEALATTTYGDDGRFPHLEALNGAQCVACFLLASFVLLLRRGSSAAGGGNKVATPWMYWRPALSNAVGPACGIVALKSINYPAQVRDRGSQDVRKCEGGALFMACWWCGVRRRSRLPDRHPGGPPNARRQIRSLSAAHAQQLRAWAVKSQYGSATSRR